jgi:solute carrier family 1 (high affinity glutamate transporter) protein 1
MTPRTSNFILAGIVVAIVLALTGVWLFGPWMSNFEWMGTLFLRALKMIIVPLVMASMIAGITSLGDVRKLGKLGAYTLLYYVTTTMLAVAVGIALVNVIRPGDGLAITAEKLPEAAQRGQDLTWTDIVLSFFSENIVKSMAEMEVLPVIVFSLVFGAVLTTIKGTGEHVIGFFQGINEAIMKMVHLLMLVAPLGVFGLVAGRFAKAENLAAELGALGKYAATVVIGLAIHSIIVLPLMLWLLGGRNPLRYWLNMMLALLTSFSTASSSATLPLTMECVVENNGVSRRAAYFVLPLGATVNMDGTALYEAVAAIFIAQAVGIELTFGQQTLIFFTATLAAIGAAGIPEAGLVTMVIVLRAVGLPLEGIGLILAIDWLLDRFRTATNVWGDACGAAIIDRLVVAGMPPDAGDPAPSAVS